MMKDEIEVGAVYIAVVSGKLVSVRIEGKSPHGGWDATNLATKQPLFFRTAHRLCGQMPTSELKP